MDEKSRVYIVVDDDNRITQIEGEYSLSNIADLSSAILVEEGAPCDRLNHAQSSYLDKQLYTDDGVLLYKWTGSEIAERSEEELEADRAPLRNAERIAELKDQLSATDYKAIKYAEGQITEEEYEPIRQQRQAWRDEINTLEECDSV